MSLCPAAPRLGGFEVRRALPRPRSRWWALIFFDQMGPAEFLSAGGHRRRHIPTSAWRRVTYLFEGEVFHRDSLGTSPHRPARSTS